MRGGLIVPSARFAVDNIVIYPSANPTDIEILGQRSIPIAE